MRYTTVKAITVWPDGDQWIVSLDDIDESGGAQATHTLDVCEEYEEAYQAAKEEMESRDLPGYEQTGKYGFNKPIP